MSFINTSFIHHNTKLEIRIQYDTNKRTGQTDYKLHKNSSGDEIANVLVNDNIAHT